MVSWRTTCSPLSGLSCSVELQRNLSVFNSMFHSQETTGTANRPSTVTTGGASEATALGGKSAGAPFGVSWSTTSPLTYCSVCWEDSLCCCESREALWWGRGQESRQVGIFARKRRGKPREGNEMQSRSEFLSFQLLSSRKNSRRYLWALTAPTNISSSR